MMMKDAERLPSPPRPFEKLIRFISESVGRGYRIEAKLAQLGWIETRLERLEPQLAQAARQIETQLAQAARQSETQLSQAEQRIEASVAANTASVAANAASAAQGFAQVSERLDRDVGALASQIGQLAGVVSKLALDQSEFGERLRALQGGTAHKAVAPSIKEARPSWPPVLERATQADLPNEIQAAVWDMEAGDESWRLPSTLMPTAPDSLPQVIDLMRAAREQLRPGDRVVMLQPPQTASLLDRDETEQVLGLLGPIEEIREVQASDGRWRIASAEARTEVFAFALRWSLPTLDEFHFRLRAVYEEALKRFDLLKVLHAIDLPESESAFPSWRASIVSLASVLGRDDAPPIAIVLPANLREQRDLAGRAVEELRNAFAAAGAPDCVVAQWVRGSIPLEASEAILSFARAHGIAFDLTAVGRGFPESQLFAYDPLVPYRPLDFDLRLPSFSLVPREPVVISRWPGRSCLRQDLSTGTHGPLDLLEADFDRSCERLLPILDRVGRQQFEREANLDTTLVALWPDYFVFNWPAPSPARVRLLEFSAAELSSPNSPLARLHRAGRLGVEDRRYANGWALLDVARRIVDRKVGKAADLITTQVESHAYLKGRSDITADAERLIAWMPEKLGGTLELGSGYGVMARRVRDRASVYVGLDLTVNQAQSLAEFAATGLVADIHVLPFSDDQFDTVIADNVIEHAHDPLAALRECRRVLRPGGRAFLVIPHDYLGPRFRNRSHFWKADEASVRLAAELAGFTIARQKTLRLAEHGVSGAFPSSGGTTGLWELAKPETASA